MLNVMKFAKKITYARIFDSLFHDIFEVPVNYLKHAAFLRHLLHYVFGGKDWIQIEPLSLHLQPLVDGFLHSNDLLLPLFHFLLERLDERRPLHRDRFDDVIVQNCLDVVASRQNANTRIAIFGQTERNVFPFVLHLLQTFL